MSYPNDQEDEQLVAINASAQHNVESEDVDWVEITLDGTPTRLSEILRDEVGLAARWGMSFQDCLRTINAIVFLAQDSRASGEIRTKSADTVYAEIPAGVDWYVPAVRLYDKFVSGSSTAVLAIHTDAKLYST